MKYIYEYIKMNSYSHELYSSPDHLGSYLSIFAKCEEIRLITLRGRSVSQRLRLVLSLGTVAHTFLLFKILAVCANSGCSWRSSPHPYRIRHSVLFFSQTWALQGHRLRGNTYLASWNWEQILGIFYSKMNNDI